MFAFGKELNYSIFQQPFKKWPLIVIIREVRGQHTRWVFTKGARIRRPDKTEIIEFKDRPEEFMPAPSYDYYDLTHKGHSVLEVFSPQSGIYHPVKRKATDFGEVLELSGAPLMEWFAMEQLKLNNITEPPKPWWQSILPWVPPLAMSVIFLVAILLTFGPMSTIASSLTSTSGNILQAIQLQTSIFQGAITVVGPPPI